MRKVGVLLLAAVILLAAGCAAADEVVRLPESRYAVTLPDGMVYEGPTPENSEAFACVYEEFLLEIHFFRFEAGMTEAVADVLAKGAEDITPVPVNGIDMIAFRYPAQDDGWKAVGYMTQDGDATQMILFWYGSMEAAEMTKTIMESIGETETV